VRLLIAFVLFLPPTCAPATDFSRRLTLRLGKVTSVTGNLPTPEDSAVFVFAANNVSLLSVSLKPLSPTLVPQAVIIFPSGEQRGPGTELQIQLHESGIYRVRVTAREQTSGRFRLELSAH
jgi:hypothetical protein